MARYRHKDETDLVWNRIRRKITRNLDTVLMDRREEMLNYLLAGAWEEYAAGRLDGKLLELETKYETLISEIVSDVVKPMELSELGD